MLSKGVFALLKKAYLLFMLFRLFWYFSSCHYAWRVHSHVQRGFISPS